MFSVCINLHYFILLHLLVAKNNIQSNLYVYGISGISTNVMGASTSRSGSAMYVLSHGH